MKKKSSSDYRSSTLINITYIYHFSKTSPSDFRRRKKSSIGGTWPRRSPQRKRNEACSKCLLNAFVHTKCTCICITHRRQPEQHMYSFTSKSSRRWHYRGTCNAYIRCWRWWWCDVRGVLQHAWRLSCSPSTRRPANNSWRYESAPLCDSICTRYAERPAQHTHAYIHILDMYICIYSIHIVDSLLVGAPLCTPGHL